MRKNTAAHAAQAAAMKKEMARETKCAQHPDRRADAMVDGAPLCEWCLDAAVEDKMAAAINGGNIKSDLACVWEMKIEIEYTAKQLAGDAANLADNLSRLCARLNTVPTPGMPWVGPLSTSVNSCGEVQGRGLNIDLNCMKLTMQRRAYGRARNRWAREQAWYAGIER